MASYGTPAQGTTYFASRLHATAWEDASDADRTRALAQATSIIDSLNFEGEKTDSEQENEFPRGGDEEVPASIQQACFEIAKALLDGVDPDLETANVGVSSEGFSSSRAAYDALLARPWVAAGVPSPTAWRYLSPFLRDGKSFKIERVS